MPQGPAPFTALADRLDQLEEELAPRADDRTRQLIRDLQTQLSQHDLHMRLARSIERNGFTRHSQDLLRAMGYEVRRVR